MSTIKIEYGTDEKGQPQFLEVPKIVKDEEGNEIDFQDVLNKVNGKVKSVTAAEYAKKYSNKDTELQQLKEKIAQLQNPSEELLALQEELEELKIKQLPEKEQELVKLSNEIKKLTTRAETAEKLNGETLSKYRAHRIMTEIQNNLPDSILPSAREDIVTLVQRHASVDDNDNIIFANLFEEGGEPLSAKDFNEKYFSQPDKAHFIATNLLPGTGTNGGGTRDLNGAQRFTGNDWRTKLASASPEERAKLSKQYNAGEVVVTDE